VTQPQQSTLARKWVFEINTGTVAVPVWTTVKGLNSLTVTEAEPNLEDDNVYEDAGYTGQTKTGLSWNAAATVMRRTDPTDVTIYDPGQEKLRLLGRTLGPTGVAHCRFYDRDGGPEAFTGFGEVSWAPQGGTPTDLEQVDITITGKGINTQITGTNFLSRAGATVVSGAAGVKFGANNATSYIVQDRQTIFAISPAGTAGAKQVIVTNTTGASVDTAADDFLYF
jgi:hypothetical protein